LHKSQLEILGNKGLDKNFQNKDFEIDKNWKPIVSKGKIQPFGLKYKKYTKRND
jgi:hypothetical protein